MQFLHLSSIDEIIESEMIHRKRRANQTAQPRLPNQEPLRSRNFSCLSLKQEGKTVSPLLSKKEAKELNFRRDSRRRLSISCLDTKIYTQEHRGARPASGGPTLEDILDSEMIFVERPSGAQQSLDTELEGQDGFQTASEMSHQAIFIKDPFDLIDHFEEESSQPYSPQQHLEQPQLSETPAPARTQPQQTRGWDLLEESFANSSSSEGSEESSEDPFSWSKPPSSQDEELRGGEPSQSDEKELMGSPNNEKEIEDNGPSLRGSGINTAAMDHIKPRLTLLMGKDNRLTSAEFLNSAQCVCSPDPGKEQLVLMKKCFEKDKSGSLESLKFIEAQSRDQKQPKTKKTGSSESRFCPGNQTKSPEFDKKGVFRGDSTNIELSGGKLVGVKNLEETQKNPKKRHFQNSSLPQRTSIAMRD